MKKGTVFLIGLSLVIALVSTANAESYRDTIIADNPFAYYRLGESSAVSAVQDEMGNNNGLFRNNPAVGVPGALFTDAGNTAVCFDRTQSQYIELTTLGDFGSTMTGGFTVEYWLRTSDSENYQAVFGTANSPTFLTDFLVDVAYHNPEELRLYFRDEHWNRYEVRFYPQGTNVKIYDGTWHHIAHGYDPSASLLEDRMIYYVDGIRQTVQVLLMGIPYDSSDFNEPMTLGAFNRRGSISYYLNGCLDEVAFYTRPLTAEEVTSHYQAATVVTITVDIDIKPGSESNCFNQNGRGVIPMAILGREDLDVSMIKVDTLSLQGLTVKMTGKSNKYLAHIENVNGDEYPDLVVQFQDSDGWLPSGNGTATLTGQLLDGTPIHGSDSICIVPEV